MSDPYLDNFFARAKAWLAQHCDFYIVSLKWMFSISAFMRMRFQLRFPFICWVYVQYNGNILKTQMKTQVKTHEKAQTKHKLKTYVNKDKNENENI